jgi:hypothetical protein
LLLVALIGLGFSGLAESPFNLGLKYGYNNSKLITNLDNLVDDNIEEGTINKYHVGGFARISLGRVFVQPEVYFNTKGGIVTSKNENDETVVDYSKMIDYQSIDVPLLLGVKVIDKRYFTARVNGGPVFSWVTSSDFSSTFQNFSFEDLKNRQMGWQAGFGFDLWFITIDGRYESNSNIFVEGSDVSAKNHVYMISVGIKLF